MPDNLTSKELATYLQRCIDTAGAYDSDIVAIGKPEARALLSSLSTPDEPPAATIDPSAALAQSANGGLSLRGESVAVQASAFAPPAVPRGLPTLFRDIRHLLGRLAECFDESEEELRDIRDMISELCAQPFCPKCGPAVMSSTWRCCKCGADMSDGLPPIAYRAAHEPPAAPPPPERESWTPQQALEFYAAGKHFDVVNGRTRILDTGAVASDALKQVSREYHDMKGLVNGLAEPPAAAPEEGEIQESTREEQRGLLNPIQTVYFRAGLLACRAYMASFVESGGDKNIADSIRANWWPFLGDDPGQPRQNTFQELTVGEYGEPGFRCKTREEVSPSIEALPLALGFLMHECGWSEAKCTAVTKVATRLPDDQPCPIQGSHLCDRSAHETKESQS